jgi:hypothetical protein
MAKAYKHLRRERTERRLKNQEFHGTIEGEALANLRRSPVWLRGTMAS